MVMLATGLHGRLSSWSRPPGTHHTPGSEANGRHLADHAPMGGTGLFFALATMGLPRLSNFVGEFMVLLGVYRSACHRRLACSAYRLDGVPLWMIQRVFFGPKEEEWQCGFTSRKFGIMAVMIAATVWLGCTANRA